MNSVFDLPVHALNRIEKQLMFQNSFSLCVCIVKIIEKNEKGFTDIRISYNIIGIKYKKCVIIFHHLVIKVNKNIL